MFACLHVVWLQRLYALLQVAWQIWSGLSNIVDVESLQSLFTMQNVNYVLQAYLYITLNHKLKKSHAV